MDNKLKTYLAEQNVDIFEPHKGHEARFLRKLNQPKKKRLSYAWLSVAASIVLCIGFFFGSTFQEKRNNQFPSKMGETQTFFVNAINQELKEIEKFRNINTETIIEKALDDIEELEEQCKTYMKDLQYKGNEEQVIQAMVINYQQRLYILQRLQKLLQTLKNPTNFNTIEFNETI